MTMINALLNLGKRRPPQLSPRLKSNCSIRLIQGTTNAATIKAYHFKLISVKCLLDLGGYLARSGDPPKHSGT